MKFKAIIHIMPRPEILDPQGKATLHGLHNLGFSQVEQVRIGKQVEITVEADDAESARASLEEACRKLLANPVIEQFRFELTEA
ncbi:MAG: phosphoribosylformylglycinamidine synthase subunit PurS [Bacteroidia bacterium]|nr:phosphoribosylformylglycinamidine synthase subunit PurS [Bacteroidia bacterium]